jgi:hypothetical protein
MHPPPCENCRGSGVNFDLLRDMGLPQQRCRGCGAVRNVPTHEARPRFTEFSGIPHHECMECGLITGSPADETWRAMHPASE